MRDYLPFGKPNFSQREIDAVSRVLRTGWIGMGPETIAFENELAAYLGAPNVVTVNSCTSALAMSLRLLGIGPGDEVVCPSLTWCSTANAALYLGATPIFCDIDPQSLCLTAESVRAALTPRTRAVVAVHFAGLAADVVALRRALPETVAVVEDAAHAFGARYEDGRRVGASGNLCCFSFYANKTLSTGEGGAIALADEAGAERLRSLRQHGLAVDAWKRFVNPETVVHADLTELGYKANYTDLQASIGRVQLARQEEFAATRAAVALIYREGLADLPLGFQTDCTATTHSRHLFVVVLGEAAPIGRDRLLHALRERRLGATVHYEPLHLMPLYTNGGTPVRLEHTDAIGDRIVTLPIGACVTPADAHEVVEAMHQLLA